MNTKKTLDKIAEINDITTRIIRDNADGKVKRIDIAIYLLTDGIKGVEVNVKRRIS